MRYIIIIISLLTLTVAACSRKSAGQGDGAVAQSIDEIVNSQRFVFKANTAIPARGRSIQLTSDYTFIVRKDTVIGNLPYFGRAYNAPIGTGGGGIDFTSTDFSYTKTQRRNGAWEIEIRPRDNREVQRLFLTVSKSGYGNLYVNSQNRQPISFNGNIEQRNR